jgi:hypothetical protein
MRFLLILSTVLSFNLSAAEEKTIHVEGNYSKGGWMDYTSSEELNLKRLLTLLERSPTGERLIREARYKASLSGQLLSDVIKVGETSLTDTTLVRKFNPRSPEHVVYESRSVVFLNRYLAWDDALLDLAHELTHYVYRESFNPYDEDFNPKDFIKGTIEGSGGEVQAFLTECRVLKELFSRQVSSRSHCQRIEDEQGQLSYNRAVDLFYHVGPYYEAFKQKLNERKIDSSFSQLKSEKINFISSAYGVPYPVAALMEYDLVLKKVCENDKRRLAYMQQGAPQRSPASVPVHQHKLAETYSHRCREN